MKRKQPQNSKKRASGKKPLAPFDKYDYYHRAVQSSEADMEFLRDTYRQLRRKRAKIFREDFCGTFANSCAWVRLGRDHEAYGLDLDREPIEYGRGHNLTALKPEQRLRVQIIQADVLKPPAFKADIVAAFNFSYFIFKKRQDMKLYFQKARDSLRRDGLFVVDCFGGTDSQHANVESTKHEGFTYFWDQANFNPISYEAVFHIHFLLKGEKAKRQNVFSYDWRVWTLPELRDLMLEVGFSFVHCYWEGTTKKGTGDGNFKRAEIGEDCEGWIAYLVAGV